MNDQIKIHKNDEESSLELFESGKEGYCSFILTTKSGDIYFSTKDVHEFDIIDLVASFMEGELKFSKKFKLEKTNSEREISETIKYNIVGFSLLLVFFTIALFRSNFNWKILAMFTPVMIVVFCKCFICKRP